MAPTALVDARLQAHHAAQIAASLGASFLEPAPDDSHPNLGWDDSLQALVGRPIPGKTGLRAGLRIQTLSLLLIDAGGAVDETPLQGMTLAAAYAALEAGLASRQVTPPGGSLLPPGYEIPHHAVADGAPFELEHPAPFVELAHWYSNGARALTQLANERADAAEVRCWPHHFDLGGLYVASTGPGGELASSVGFGLSPGDDAYAEPYAYVSPWPAPPAAALPARPGVRWRTEGFTAAVLTGSELLAAGADSEQEARFPRFLAEAFTASRDALAQ